MRAVGSNSWTVLWMCAPKVIQSNVTPAPRSPLAALTVTSLALEYQSGQAVALMRCSQIFPGGAAITMSLWAKRSACSGTMPCGQWMCAERRWMSSMIDMIVPSIRSCNERMVWVGGEAGWCRLACGCVRPATLVRAGGALVTIATPPTVQPENGRPVFFVVEPDRLRLPGRVQRLG